MADLSLLKRKLYDRTGVAVPAQTRVIVREQHSRIPVRVYNSASPDEASSISGETVTDSTGSISVWVVSGTYCLEALDAAGRSISITHDIQPGDAYDSSEVSSSLPSGAVSPVGLDSQGRLVGPNGVLDASATSGPPLALNNRVAILGDSRVANATENSNVATTQRVTARSYAAWMQAESDYRFRFVGNYGINTDTIQGCTTRLTGAGISGGTALTDPRRGWLNVYDPGSTAGVVVVLVGVNNTNEAMSTAGPKYDALLTGLLDAGKVVVICNELPNSDQSGQGSFNLLRRNYLATWPYTSTALSGEQKKFYATRVINVDTYSATALTPDSYFPKTGYYPSGDLLHPGTVGNRAIGNVIATALKSLATKAGFAARNALPAAAADCLLTNGMLTGSVAITATNSETAGAGGANMNGTGGACITGALPTGWSIVRDGALQTLLNAAQPVSGSSLSVTCTKTLDSDGFDALRIQVSGQVGTTASRYSIAFRQEQYKTAASLSNINGLGGSVTDGDELFSIARVSFVNNPRGLLGTNVEILASSATYPSTAFASMSGSIADSGLQYDGMPAFDRPVMSQGRVLPTGFASTVETKTFNQQFALWVLGGTVLDIDVTISRFGVVKNR